MVFMYNRVDDKAYYVDEAGYTVKEPRPSVSPGPIKVWTVCMDCNKGGDEQAVCYTKKNEQRRETARSNV